MIAPPNALPQLLFDLLEVFIKDPEAWPVVGDYLRELNDSGWRPTVEQCRAVRVECVPERERGSVDVAWRQGDVAKMLAEKWWNESMATPTPTFAKALLKVLR